MFVFFRLGVSSHFSDSFSVGFPSRTLQKHKPLLFWVPSDSFFGVFAPMVVLWAPGQWLQQYVIPPPPRHSAQNANLRPSPPTHEGTPFNESFCAMFGTPGGFPTQQGPRFLHSLAYFFCLFWPIMPEFQHDAKVGLLSLESSSLKSSKI